MTNEMQDPVEAAFAQLGIKREYNLGDLVHWAGELWYVDGWRFDAQRTEGEAFEDIEYSLSRVYADGTWNDYAEVYQDDEELRLVCRAEFADEFIANNGMDASGGRSAAQNATIIAGVMAMSNSGKHAPKAVGSAVRQRERDELSRRKAFDKRMDDLLDEYNALVTAGELAEANAVIGRMRLERFIFESGGWVDDDNDKRR